MIDYLLSPVLPETFFTEYFEKKHLLLSRDNPEYFKEILSLSDVDKLLFEKDLYHPDKRIVDSSTDQFPESKTYTFKGSTKIDPLKFTRYYADGSTLVLARAHQEIESLRKLVTNLAADLQQTFQTNLYVTPANSQGFSPHYDTHDVFVLQFHGKKTWRIYDNVLPLADSSQSFKKGEYDVGKVVDEFVLHQGDTLYIPRGVPHDAFCEDGASGHITLGMNAKTWAEQIANKLLEASKDHLALRRYPRFKYSGEESNEHEKQVMGIVNELILGLRSDVDVQDMFFADQRPIIPGMLLSNDQVHNLNADSMVSLRDKSQLRMVKTGETLTVKFYDIKLEIPAAAADFIDFLVESNAEVKVSQIKSVLDLESKLLLTKELIRNGILNLKV